MPTRLKGLLVKDITQFCRDRVMLILILWLYTIEVIVCTYALSFEIKKMPLAVVDYDRTPASRALIQNFMTTDVFIDAGYATSAQEAEDWLQSGRARVALIIPKQFQDLLVINRRPDIQLLLDGTNSNMAAQAQMYAQTIVHRFSQSRLPDPSMSKVKPATRIWYNPDQTYTSFMVLSMIALAALMVGIIHPAASIVREKEAGTLEQLRVTPIKIQELFLSKTMPTLIIGLLSIFPSLLIVWWFGVPFRGSIILLLALTAIFLISAISLGVLIAAISKTLQQALLLAFFGLFPLMFLSGSLAPIESMPDFLQTISMASPLRHYLDIILGIFLKGAGMTVLWPQTIYMIVIGLPLFFLAAIIFRKQI